MKKLCIAVAAAMLLSLTACSAFKKEETEASHAEQALPEAVAPGDIPEGNTTPAGAVAGLLDAVIKWDMGVAAQFMTSGGDEAAAGAYRAVLLPFIERMEYEVGAERITGDAAVVDVAVTAVDASQAFTGLTVAAARYAVSESLSGGEVDMQAFVQDYLSEQVDFSELTRTKRFAEVHLVRDGMGRWRLDSANPENRGFYNALSGGLLDTVTGLQELAERYNINW